MTTKTEKVLPPAALTADCPDPGIPGGRTLTNLDVLTGLTDYRTALAKCNDDKRRLREWGR